jgi:hypothetical protein
MGAISFTMDTWTDLDLKPYMAVIAHWIQKHSTQTSHTVDLMKLLSFMQILLVLCLSLVITVGIALLKSSCLLSITYKLQIRQAFLRTKVDICL